MDPPPLCSAAHARWFLVFSPASATAPAAGAGAARPPGLGAHELLLLQHEQPLPAAPTAAAAGGDRAGLRGGGFRRPCAPAAAAVPAAAAAPAPAEPGPGQRCQPLLQPAGPGPRWHHGSQRRRRRRRMGSVCEPWRGAAAACGWRRQRAGGGEICNIN